jgi:polar amino acid transport system substrate-binding protein
LSYDWAETRIRSQNLKRLFIILLIIMATSAVHAADAVVLANSVWSPFIIAGEQRGTSEQIVCQALERAGRECSVEVKEWEKVLVEAEAGSIDGIAAAWKSAERAEFLLFSEPYLTNRIVPIVGTEKRVEVKQLSDLIGLRVAMVKDFAYGEEIEDMLLDMQTMVVEKPLEAIMMVRNGEADVAVVDELVARNVLDETLISGVEIADNVLVFRDLHFAVSRKNPEAEQIIADFHRSFEIMLSDGTMNEILNMDWLATDFGHTGSIDIVMRTGVDLEDLDNPYKQGSVYALEQSEYQLMQDTSLKDSRVEYQVQGSSHSSLQSALTEVFGKDIVCEHKEYSSVFDCTKLLKKLGTNP